MSSAYSYLCFLKGRCWLTSWWVALAGVQSRVCNCGCVAIPTAVMVLSACRMYLAHIELGQW